MAWETFPYSYTSPHIHSWIFYSLWVIIFWVRVTHKMLNLNWEKIHSIILSVTCHGLRNFPLLIHIPLYPFVNFWNPTSYYILSLSFDPPHPTPTWHTPPHPTPTWHTPPYPPLMYHPTPPHPTPSWPTHPTLPHPTPSWPTHPTPPTPSFMTHPPHPTHPTLHDPPTPSHPPHNHKIRVQECYGGRAMSCPWHVGGVEALGPPFGRHAALRLFHW